jgi:hypothetical protein
MPNRSTEQGSAAPTESERHIVPENSFSIRQDI